MINWVVGGFLRPLTEEMGEKPHEMGVRRGLVFAPAVDLGEKMQIWLQGELVPPDGACTGHSKRDRTPTRDGDPLPMLADAGASSCPAAACRPKLKKPFLGLLHHSRVGCLDPLKKPS